MDKDRYYMQKTIELARKGEGKTGVNPLVGAIVVKNDKIIGKGYHKEYGGPHAEVYALKEAGEKSKNATLYVNLEPCCHHGKTGPCNLQIIKSDIKRVVVGMKDPNQLVCGKGIEKLSEKGLDVKIGVLEEKCRKLNEVFIKYITSDLPFIYMKAAQTLDGFLATVNGDSQWVTGEKARLYGHKLRNKADAILVGINTVLKDNPRLNTRLPGQEGEDCIRIILDPYLEIDEKARIINQKSSKNTILVTGKNISDDKKQRLESKTGIEIMSFKLETRDRIPLKKLLKECHRRKIGSILVEGGGMVNYSFLRENLVDKFYCFIAPRIYGGNDGISTFRGKGPHRMKDVKQLKDIKIEKVDDDLLIKAYFQG